MEKLKQDTIWKLRETEQLLKNRISKKECQDMITVVERRTDRDLKTEIAKLEDQIFKSFKDTEIELDTAKNTFE